jgi:UDP-N-acetylmuramate dehydrogenase
MLPLEETQQRLAQIPNIQLTRNEMLARHTRFAIGGPAALFADTGDPAALMAALRVVRASGQPSLVIGAGTNLIVSDDGFPGVVLRYHADHIDSSGTRVKVESGADLQHLVDYTIERGLSGIHTMTGIPGWVGAAIYGNAGAYGRSIHQSVMEVRFFDGECVRALDNAACEFRYRESVFKKRKDWIILSAELSLALGDAAELRKKADEIMIIRNAKYPPTMKCAGSIFKNLIYSEIPEQARAAVPQTAVREGKVPSAWFLEQTGVKGLANGGIHVADYHANLVYNAGAGTARQLVEVIGELKRRVKERFNLEIEEEVQYVGF